MEVSQIYPPTILLIGFSTAGKSHYLREIEQSHSDKFDLLDSDKYVSKEFGGHIYNVFMRLGHLKGLEYVESKEEEFIQYMSNNINKPQLIAAGPVLLQRKGWKEFYNKRNPFVIHLDKSVISIYRGLLERKKDQRKKLNILDPNFGCWDNQVTTELLSGKYVDISESRAIANIQKHLNDNNPTYSKYRNHFFDSDELKNDKRKQHELISLILENLAKNHG